MHIAVVYLVNLDVGEGHETLDIKWERVLTKLDWMITSREEKGKTINNISLIVFPPFTCYFAGNPFQRGLLSNKRCMYCKTREVDMSPSRDIYVLCPRNSCSTPMMFRFLRETHIRNTKYNIQIRTTWAEVGGIYGDFQRKSCSNPMLRFVTEHFFFTCLTHAPLLLWWQQEIDNCS